MYRLSNCTREIIGNITNRIVKICLPRTSLILSFGILKIKWKMNVKLKEGKKKCWKVNHFENPHWQYSHMRSELRYSILICFQWEASHVVYESKQFKMLRVICQPSFQRKDFISIVFKEMEMMLWQNQFPTHKIVSD